jgi:hypothetical protein
VRGMEFGRRPKHDDFDDISPLRDAEDEFEEFDDKGDEDEDEEVDFDTPTFKRDGIWNDYAEDLDFDD